MRSQKLPPPRQVVRFLGASWLFDVKNLSQSLFFILVAAIQPVIFATIGFFMFRAGERPGSLLYVALGAGLMGIWSSTLFGCGGIIQWERYQGTLEVLMTAPVPFVLVMIPATLANASIGIYSLLATLLWGRVFFGVPFELADPLLFFIAVPVTIVSLGFMGLVIASTFILYRNANALSNLLEYPVWLATGLIVPVALLPDWATPISWVLGPTWGMRAIRYSALGGDAVGPLLMTLALGAVYLVVGAIFLGHFERLARERATLALT